MYRQVIEEIRKKEYTPDTVGEAAERIYRVGQGGIPVKIIEICRQIGFSVYQQALPGNICGYILIDGELKDYFHTDRIISVNAAESNKRRRFTVAHELAHYLFDFQPNDKISYRELEYEKKGEVPASDLRANRFAAELLMPEDAFEKEYRLTWEKHRGSSGQFYETVQELSDLFLVPPKAVERRIREELKLQ